MDETVRRLFKIARQTPSSGEVAAVPGRPSPLQVETYADGSVKLRGELDMDTVAQLKETIDEVIHPGRPIVIDMAELTFIDSSGIRFLVLTYQATGVRVVICNPSRQVRRVLELLDGRAKPEAWVIQTD